MNEQWMPVPGFEGRYQVSDLGRVRSLPRVGIDVQGRRHSICGRILRPIRVPSRDPKHPYNTVVLFRAGQKHRRSVHRLVLEAFIGSKPGMVARHLNGIAGDDRLVNLAWGTPRQNTLDSVAHGTHPMARRTHCPQGHEFTPGNTYQTKRGRRCRTCSLARSAAWRKKHPGYQSPSHRTERQAA